MVFKYSFGWLIGHPLFRHLSPRERAYACVAVMKRHKDTGTALRWLAVIWCNVLFGWCLVPLFNDIYIGISFQDFFVICMTIVGLYATLNVILWVLLRKGQEGE